MTNTLRIGQLPGRINEFAVEAGTTLEQALTIAEINADGFEVKVDGVKVTDFNTDVSGAGLVLLSKMVKGNSGMVRIGQLPGRIQEFAVEAGTTLEQALTIAELNADGFEVKVDGVKVTDFNTSIDGAGLILLSKMVKGNANIVRVGQLPGRINEFAFEPPTTYAQVFEAAELNPDGFEVKADGVKVTDFNTEIGSTQLILLSKQIKGN